MKIADESITFQTKTNESLIREVQLCQMCQENRRNALLMNPISQMIVQQSQLCQQCSHGYIAVVQQELDIHNVIVTIFKYPVCKKCTQNDFCKNKDFLQDYIICRKCKSKYQLIDLFQNKCPICQYDQCVNCHGSLSILGYKEGKQCYDCRKSKIRKNFYNYQISMIISLILIPVLSIFYTIKGIRFHKPPWYLIILFGIMYYIYWIGKALILICYSLILGMKRGEMVLVQL